MTQHLNNLHYQQWFYNFFTNLYPCVEDRGSSPVNHIFRLSKGTSDDSNTPNSVKKLLVSRIILRITARVSYEHNILLRFIMHLIWLIIQKSFRFTWAELRYMPTTLTFKALWAGVGSWYALDWAFTLEISCRSRTVGIRFDLGLSKGGSSSLPLIIWTSLIIRYSRSI